jgi:ComEC/Rec2-like protein
VTGHDWRLAPLAIAAWAGCWAGTSGWCPSPELLIGGAAILVVCILLGRRVWLTLAACTLVVAFLISGMRSSGLHEGVPAQWAAGEPLASALVRLEGEPTLVKHAGRSLAISRATLLRLEVNKKSLGTSQPVVLLAGDQLATDLTGIAPGAIYRLQGRLGPSEPDSREAFVMRVSRITGQVREPDVFNTFVSTIHAGLRQAASHSPSEQAALVPSLVVGDRSGITKELTEVFRATSLSHLLAVSGSNLTLLLGVLLLVVRFLGVRGWAIRGIAAVGVALFVLVCRAEPSVLRAAAMGLVALPAMGTGRGSRSVRNLGVAVLVLLPLDPWLARSWGFALSAAACLGISIGSEPLKKTMMAWAPGWLAEAVAVPLAAQLATIPLTTALSGQVSVVGVVANALAGPFVGPGTVLGLAAAVLIWIPPVAAVVAWLAGWAVQPILWIAHLGAAMPGAVLEWPTTPPGIAASALLVATVVVLVRAGFRRRVGFLLLALGLLLAGWFRPVPLDWPGRWQAVFCSVGQGDSTVLRAGESTAVLIDTGPEPAPTIACLESLGIKRILLLVLTHFHADHIGGTEAVVSRFRPELVLVSPLRSPGFAAASVEATANAHGASLLVAEPGQRMTVGDVSWVTVSAWQPGGVSAAGESESSVENDSSVVGIAEVAGMRVLLPGDAEPGGQEQAIRRARNLGIPLGVHVLKIPHHGSSRQEPAFLEASSAQLAVASCGLGNDYGHPSPKTLSRVTALGMAVARTDTEGSVAVWLDGERLGVRRWRG